MTVNNDQYIQKFYSSVQQTQRQTPSQTPVTGVPYLLKIDDTAVDTTGQFATVTIGGKPVKCQLASNDYCVVFQDATSPVPVLFRGGNGGGVTDEGWWRD